MPQFPETWRIAPLADVMDAVIDYRGKSPNKTAFGVPLITAKIVKDGTIQEPDEFIAIEDYEGWMRRGIPQAGDIVMTTEAPLGEIAQLDGRKVALAQRLITLRGKSGVLDNTYLKYLMQSRWVQDQLEARATGTTVHGIRQSELRKVLLVLPSFAEQRAIAHILGSLDDKIELNRQMNQTLEEMARAIFKSWFVDFDPVHAKARGEQPAGMDAAAAALFPDGFENTELGLVPSGWRMASILNIANRLSGGTPKTNNPEYWNGGIQWVSAKDVKAAEGTFILETERRISQLGLDSSSAKILSAGTSIVTARGTVGAYCLLAEPMAMNQTNYGLKAKLGYGDHFVFFSLARAIAWLQQNTHGTIFDTITTQTLERTSVVIPTIPIADAFEEAAKPLMEMIKNSLYQSRTLAELRDTLLPKLMSGEMRVPEAAVS